VGNVVEHEIERKVEEWDIYMVKLEYKDDS
jgi:hypothetical protein